jgi:hypothetical protein
MVDVAQLVEPRIVIPAVAGSSPVVHPTLDSRRFRSAFLGKCLFGPLAHLNRFMDPAGRLAEAAAHVRRDAVVSLHSLHYMTSSTTR